MEGRGHLVFYGETPHIQYDQIAVVPSYDALGCSSRCAPSGYPFEVAYPRDSGDRSTRDLGKKLSDFHMFDIASSSMFKRDDSGSLPCPASPIHRFQLRAHLFPTTDLGLMLGLD